MKKLFAAVLWFALLSGHVVKWYTVKDKDGQKHKIAEVNQARFCWYHGTRVAGKAKNKARRTYA